MLDSNLVKDCRKIKWWDVFFKPHFEIENENNMVSPYQQDEKKKNLKYTLKELVIRLLSTVAMFLLFSVE